MSKQNYLPQIIIHIYYIYIIYIYILYNIYIYILVTLPAKFVFILHKILSLSGSVCAHSVFQSLMPFHISIFLQVSRYKTMHGFGGSKLLLKRRIQDLMKQLRVGRFERMVKVFSSLAFCSQLSISVCLTRSSIRIQPDLTNYSSLIKVSRHYFRFFC